MGESGPSCRYWGVMRGVVGCDVVKLEARAGNRCQGLGFRLADFFFHGFQIMISKLNKEVSGILPKGKWLPDYLFVQQSPLPRLFRSP